MEGDVGRGIIAQRIVRNTTGSSWEQLVADCSEVLNKGEEEGY